MSNLQGIYTQVYKDGQPYGNAQALDQNGQLVINMSLSDENPHTFTATFPGGPVDNPSQGNTVNVQAVNPPKHDTQTVVTAPSAPIVNQPFQVVIQVTETD